MNAKIEFQRRKFLQASVSVAGTVAMGSETVQGENQDDSDKIFSEEVEQTSPVMLDTEALI